MYKEWNIWLRSYNKNIFPRQIGLKRRLVCNYGDLVNMIYNRDFYVNIFSEFQKENAMFDTIFLDIDEHNYNITAIERLEKLFKQKDKVEKYLEREGIIGRWYFTGNGFHCYIDFPILKFRNRRVYGKVIRNFIYEILDRNDKNLIDFQTTGDSNRMARFPLTRHEKTKLRMIRINPDMELEDIINHSLSNDINYIEKECNYVNDWLKEYLNSLQKDIKEIDEEERNKINIELSKLKLPPCIEKGIELLISTGELEHFWRFHIGTYLIRVMDYDMVERIFSMANDYNSQITKYQLNNLKRYKPYACKRCVLYGICPYGEQYRRCPYGNLSDFFLGRLLE